MSAHPDARAAQDAPADSRGPRGPEPVRPVADPGVLEPVVTPLGGEPEGGAGGRRRRPPRHLADLGEAERARVVVDELGERGFRARQLSVHYFQRLVDDPDEMTDLPHPVRERLVEALLPRLASCVRRAECDAGTTVKWAWRLFDGALTESVLMCYPDRATVCVSSQAGCGMGCPFCATGQAGLTRNLSTAEIVEQVVAAARELARGTGASARTGTSARSGTSARPGRPAAGGMGDGGKGPTRVGNVVFMGMGEPLANYGAVVGAVRRLITPAPGGLGLSARGITVSTVGLVPAMDRLAGEGLPVTLALSLHAPDDAARDELVPLNTRWNVAAALDAARRYHTATGRRVSIEYALIRDVNDQAWRGDQLGRLLRARGDGWVHVNVIPLNPTPGSRWTASAPAVQETFVARVAAHGVAVTMRDTRGREIAGACGQLAATIS